MQVLGILAAASLSVGLLLAPGPAPAVEPTGASIANLVVDPGPFRVDGVARSAAASISVDIMDPAGRAPCEDRGSPNVVLTRTAGGPAERVSVALHQVAGTPESGSYVGVWNIASTRSGVWTVTSVWWCTNYWGSDMVVDPRRAGVVRTITVIGTNLPRVTKVRSPAVVMWRETQDVLVSYTTATGRPLANRRVHVSDWDGTCAYEPVPRRTSALGRLALRSEGTWSTLCLRLATDDGQAVLVDLTVSRRERFIRVSAAPDSWLIPRSGSTAVRGSVAPAPSWNRALPSQVQLLRRDRSVWTVVDRVRVRASGRYTLIAPGTSAARGRHEYRVVASTFWASTMVPTTSRTFVLTGR